MADKMITLVVSETEHRMILAALDKKVWSLEQTGLPSAYYVTPAYKRLRAELADVQGE